MRAPTPLPADSAASDRSQDADVWDGHTDRAATTDRELVARSASEIRLSPGSAPLAACALPALTPPRPPARSGTSATASSATILPPPEGAARAAQAERLRVSVRTSVRDPTLLVVRRLPEGAALPAGTREAVLLITNVRDTLSDAEPDESELAATTGSVAR